MFFALLLGFNVPRLGLGLGLAGVLGLFYVYGGYPALLWLLARARKPMRVRPSAAPGISLIIAAHNEGAHLRRKIEATLRLDYPRDRLEIIVASDGSTDGTDAIAREFAGEGVQLLRIPERGGKTNAQNHAALLARNEILVFSDATTLFHGEALRRLAGNYADLRVGAVSGRYQYFDATGSSTAAGSICFWSFENRIKALQSRLGTLTGCSGCIYSVRRSLYTPLPAGIISDLVQPLHVLLQGFRVVFEPRALAWEESTPDAEDELRMRVRVITRGIRGLLSVPALLAPWRHPWVAFQLWSHKILRWCTPLFLLLIFAGNLLLVDRPVFQFTLMLQLGFYLSALALAALPERRRPRLLSLPLYLCTINAAGLISLFQLLQGRDFTAWQPSRR